MPPDGPAAARETGPLLEALGRGERCEVRIAEITGALEAFELVRMVETALGGPLRLLRRGDLVVVAEAPPGRPRAIFRPFPDLGSAEAFVAERLDTYDRMWDGCGCRIDYDQ